ncbi:unnamed protein product, partial [marine sediment metagenome]
DRVQRIEAASIPRDAGDSGLAQMPRQLRGGPAAVIESRAIPKPIPKLTHSATTL